MGWTILVVGISGVGKTTLCREFADQHADVVYISASGVLRELTGLSDERLRRADAATILQHQKILSETLRSRIEASDQKYLIDGQVVIDNGRELVVVQLDTMRRISPSGIILLRATVDEVLRRRRLAGGRFWPDRDASQLHIQLSTEEKTTIEYGKALGIPVHIGDASGNLRLDDAVSQLVASV